MRSARFAARHGDDAANNPLLPERLARPPAEPRVRVPTTPGAAHSSDRQLEDPRRAVADWAGELLEAEAGA